MTTDDERGVRIADNMSAIWNSLKDAESCVNHLIDGEGVDDRNLLTVRSKIEDALDRHKRVGHRGRIAE